MKTDNNGNKSCNFIHLPVLLDIYFLLPQELTMTFEDQSEWQSAKKQKQAKHVESRYNICYD